MIATLDVVGVAACSLASFALVCSYPSDRFTSTGLIGSRCGTHSNGSIAPQTFLNVDAPAVLERPPGIAAASEKAPPQPLSRPPNYYSVSSKSCADVCVGTCLYEPSDVVRAAEATFSVATEMQSA